MLLFLELVLMLNSEGAVLNEK